ncbi:MAG TPA: histidine phosphatase family protein [Pseudomonas sp.]|nr:histidine phosphatase family protein [Pseudomonas sp.]
MGSIYLIRHGQASFGADDYDVLCANGVRQSQILGEHLARLDTRLDHCYSGELQRQRHTAEHALERLGAHGQPTPTLRIEPAFNEFKADELIRAHLPELLEHEPRALDILRNAASHRGEFQRLFQFVIDGWLSGRLDKAGLESWESFATRVERGLRRVIEQAGNAQARIAIFTSGGAITALLHRLIGVPPLQAFELNWQIVNTSLTHLKFRGSDVSLASFNNHAHLELLKAPELITYR